MVNDNKAYKIARYAVMFATIFVAMMLDRVISSGLPVSTAACVLLVTFSFCFLENKPLDALVSCTLFGFVSLAKEFIYPSSVSGFPVYTWPLITLLPRILMGAVTWLVFVLMRKIVKGNDKRHQRIIFAVSTFFGLVANTVFFLSALNIAKSSAGESIVALTKTIVVWNIIPEYTISLVLSPIVIFGVRRGLKINVSTNEKEG